MQTLIFSSIKVVPARNQLAAVLKRLLEEESISEQETSFNGFRSRISDLRLKYGLDVRHTEVSFVNQFGRESSYRKHYLLVIDKEKALLVYEKINK